MSKSFNIKIEGKKLHKLRGAQGWFLNLLLSYFYANMPPNKLDIKYCYRANLVIPPELSQETLFSRFNLLQLDHRDLKHVERPSGHPSNLYYVNVKNTGNKGPIIDFFPAPGETPLNRFDRIVLAANWMHISGFIFTYDDVATITVFPDTATPSKILFVKLRTPIIWTTRDSKGNTQTHYKYGVSLNLPYDYAENIEKWFQKLLF